MRKSLAAVLLLLLFAASAFAAQKPPQPPAPATWYVSATTGLDRNVGNRPDKPFATIKKAVSVAKGGDSIRIAAGSYAESVSLAGTVSLTFQGGWNTKFTTFNPDVYHSVLRGSGGASVGFGLQDCYGIVLSGLEVTAFGEGIHTMNDDYGKVSLTVNRCRIYSNPIGIYYRSGYLDITQCEISGGTYGIYAPPIPAFGPPFDWKVMNIQRNRIFGNSESGIWLDGCTPGGNNAFIANNLFYNNGNNNISIWNICSNIFNNTIVGGVNGIVVNVLPPWAGYASIFNNVITGVSNMAVYGRPVSSGGSGVRLTLSTNDLFGNGIDYTGDIAVNAPDLNLDPALDASLHLTAGSPCINVGTTAGGEDYDFDGNPRPATLGGDGLFDIGADEFVPAP